MALHKILPDLNSIAEDSAPMDNNFLDLNLPPIPDKEFSEENDGDLGRKFEKSEGEELGKKEGKRSGIWFAALLDAVECAMEEEYGSEASKVEEESNDQLITGRRRRRVVVEVEEEVSRSPLVKKTKRGRNQVLPCKYRDSVMESLTHLSSSRHSRSSSSTYGSTKRRPRIK